jgi:WD40 repeat protein/energy-coupling factor transporter ATP-binding protein EcfA2
MLSPQNPIKIFVSYSHKDDDLCQKLNTHLQSLVRQGEIVLWSDRDINSGREWAAELKKNLESAQIILLLISPDFITSNYCYDKEMKLAIDRYNKGEDIRIIPIILRPCDWKFSPVDKLQALPKNSLAVSLWDDIDSAFFDIEQGIKKIINSIQLETMDTSEKPKCPYPGIEPLTDRKHLFGRDTDINDIAEKLEKNGLVYLVGESGIGKTSVVQMGVIPHFENKGWITAGIWNPTTKPISDLRKIFYRLKEFIDPKSKAITQIYDDGLTPVINELEKDKKLLLIIDDFRKILDNKSDEAKKFITHITDVNKEKFITLIITRTSYLESLASCIDGENASLNDSLCILKGIDSDAIKELIVEPAESVKYKLEKGLSEEIFSNLTGSVGLTQQLPSDVILRKSIFLPILQLTLKELWKKCDGEKLLTISNYKEIKKGGGAIDRHFESIYMEMADDLKSDEKWIRRIMLKLIHVEKGEKGEKGQDTRMSSYRKELLDMGDNFSEKEIINNIVEEMIAKGVLKIREDANQNATENEVIEIAYDFISIWSRFTRWINDDRGKLWIFQQIEDRCEEWKKNPIDSNCLPEYLIKFIDADQLGDIMRWCKPIEDFNCFLKNSRSNAEKIELGRKYKLGVDAKKAENNLRSSNPEKGTFEAIRIFNEAQETGVNVVQDIIHKAMEIHREKFCIKKDNDNENLKRHTGSIKCVTVSPDKKYIASSGRDGMIFLWDSEGNYKSSKKTDHQDIIWSILFSSSMEFIVSAGENGKIYIWNLHEEGESIEIGEGIKISDQIERAEDSKIETLCIRALAVSVSDKYIAAGSKDEYAHLWELTENNTCQYIRSFKHDDWVMSVVFSLDEKHIYTGCARGGIRCWEISGTSDKPISIWTKHEGWVRTLAINENYLISGGEDKTIRLWDLKSVKKIPEKQVLIGHEDKILTVRLDPSGNFIASGSADKTIRLWDFDGNQLGVPLRGHKDWVRSISILSHSNNQFIVSASRDSTIRIWDLEGNILAKTLPTPGINRVISVAISHDKENYKIASGGEDSSICLWDKDGYLLDYQFVGGKHSSWIRSIKFTPDNNYVITGSEDVRIGIWNLSSNPRTFRSEVQKIEGNTDEGNKAWIRAIDISADGKYLVSASDANTYCIWKFNENWSNESESLYLEDTCESDKHDGRVTSVAFSPKDENDEYLIASASEDKTICLWDLKGDRSCEFTGHKNRVLSVRFSPDSNYLISGSQDKTLRLWDLKKVSKETEDISEAVEYNGHTDAVRAVLFSPDSKMVISGSADSTIRIWDLYGNQIGDPLTGHSGAIRSLDITPDGKFIISGSEDGTVRRWNLGKLEDWVKICCDRIMGNKCSTEEHKDEAIKALKKLNSP